MVKMRRGLTAIVVVVSECNVVAMVDVVMAM